MERWWLSLGPWWRSSLVFVFLCLVFGCVRLLLLSPFLSPDFYILGGGFAPRVVLCCSGLVVGVILDSAAWAGALVLRFRAAGFPVLAVQGSLFLWFSDCLAVVSGYRSLVLVLISCWVFRHVSCSCWFLRVVNFGFYSFSYFCIRVYNGSLGMVVEGSCITHP